MASVSVLVSATHVFGLGLGLGGPGLDYNPDTYNRRKYNIEKLLLGF